MDEGPETSGIRDTWEAAAPGWAKWEEAFSVGLGDATDALIEMAGVAPGMRVLDVACGAGHQTLRLAQRVGPAGRVVASDISARMLAYVRDAAAAAGLGNVETLERPADRLAEAVDAPFDAAISRLGLMLFTAPVAAVRAVRQVLRPGARFAALVFTTPAANPFYSETMAVLRRHAGSPPPPPGSPGLFALGAEGALEAALSEGGLAEVRTRIVTATLGLASAAEALAMVQEAFGAYRAVVAGLGEAERRAAWAEVGEVLAGFEADGRFEVGCELIVGSGAA
jgi:ubiquinone/menaquinone biosynthesis C-methylase UbiE